MLSFSFRPSFPLHCILFKQEPLYFKDIGQQFDEEPWQLFLDYCHRCPSGNGWSEGEWKNIWKSAQKDCPTPSCKADGVDNCIRAWYWNNYIKPSLPERRDRTPSLALFHHFKQKKIGIPYLM